VLERGKSVAPGRPQPMLWHLIGYVLEERIDPGRKRHSEILDPRIRDRRCRLFAEPELLARLRRGKIGQLLHAVFDDKSALRSAQFEAPPSAQTHRGIAPLTEHVADAAAGEADMDAGDRYHEIGGAAPKTRTIHEGMDVGDVPTEMAH